MARSIFEAGHFALKFLHGNLDYTLSTYWFEASLRAYQAQGRPVIEQTLDLTPAQQQRLTELLAVNLRPENRRYRYHFLFDNCSTRIRDILEAALGEETLHAQALPDDAPTFRALIDPYQRAVPFLDAGIDVLLGAPADRSADGRDIMFLPEYLMEAFGKAQIGMGETARPLVARTDTLFWIAGYGASGKRFPWEFVAAWLLFAGGLALTLRRPGVIRALDAPFFSGDRGDRPADCLSLVRFAPRRHQREPPSLLGLAYACAGGGSASRAPRAVAPAGHLHGGGLGGP